MNKDEILNYRNSPNGIGDQLINAFIQAGFNFFSTLAGVGATGAISDPKLAVLASVISAGLGFFGSLMIQRGLKKKE